MSLSDIALSRLAISLGSGLLAIILLYLARKGKKKLSDKRKEYKYPVSGEYIGRFEEESEGDIKRQTAYTVIEQSGDEISGESTLQHPSENRVSILRGEISADENHIYGYYVSKDPYDEYQGSFFFHIESDDFLDGFWAGYTISKNTNDSRLDSGKYNLRAIEPLTITAATTDDGSTVAALSEEYFPEIQIEKVIKTTESGDGIWDLTKNDSIKDDFIRIARSKRDTSYKSKLVKYIKYIDYLGIKKQINNYSNKLELKNGSEKPIGFIACRCLSQEEFLDVFPVEESELPASFSPINRIGVIDVICVNQEYQDRGVATNLIIDSLESFKKQDAEIVISFIGVGDSIESIFNSCGFEHSRQVKVESIPSNTAMSEYYNRRSKFNLVVWRNNS